MFGFAVRLAIGITCSALLWTEALGSGPPTYALMAVMFLAAVWKWVYRLIRLITGASTAISRSKSGDDQDGGISEHIEERIRLAALQQAQPPKVEPELIRAVAPQQQSFVPQATFGKRR